MGNYETIEDGALFISDAHYPNHGTELLELLYQIDSKKIRAVQLFLMGDIFDLLIGSFEKSYAPNKEAIELIKSIAQHTPIYYFEGNHDFQLSKIFTNIKIFRREDQPQYMGMNGFIIGLSHGDRYAVGWKHSLMSKVLRNSLVLSVIKILRPNIVAEKTAGLKEKEICHEISNFDSKAKEIFDNYAGAFWVIEGHYHQARKIHNYISLPSLACHKQVAVVKDSLIEFVNIEDLLLS